MTRLPLFVVLSLVLGAFWIPVGAQTARPTILVLGDSLSAAFGIATDAGWVHLLQERLVDQGLPYQVVNASVSGETTAGGLTRLPALLAEHQPQLLIIALGANDGLRGFSFDTIRDNLTGMTRLGRESHALVLIAGVRLPPNYGAAYIDGFQAVFSEVAASQGVALVPQLLAGVAEDRELMQADGIHPGPAAQPRILANIWSELEPQLVKLGQSPK